MFGLTLYLALLAAADAAPPPLSDLERFPSQEVADDCYRFGLAHRRWLETQLELDLPHRGYWSAWLRDADYCRACWSALQDAHGTWDQDCPESAAWGQDYQRQALERLRDLLGPADYALGVMPPAAPLWWFHQLD